MNEGSGREFAVLYETYRVPVYHTALTVLKNRAAAEDVLQEVFVTAYETLEGGGNIRNFRAWILKVAHNRALNALRAGGREFPEEELPLPEPAAGVEDEVIGRILSAQVLQCITPEENLAFSLHCLDGYTYREIAEAFQLPVGTVQTRCRTARKKMKEAIRRL